MLKFLITLTFFVVPALGFGTTLVLSNSDSNLHPLVVLVENNPWINSINSDAPSIVIYKEGLIIYKEITVKYQCVFHSLWPSQKVFDSLIRSLSLKNDSLFHLPARIDPYKNKGYSVAEQPESDLYIFTRKKGCHISVYGELTAPVVKNGLPFFLRTLLAKLKGIQTGNDPLWHPAYLELMLWPKQKATVVKQWPATWPGINSPQCTANNKPHTSYTYTLRLVSSLENDLRGLLSSLSDEDAVSIDNHKCAILYRYPLPGENKWRALRP